MDSKKKKKIIRYITKSNISFNTITIFVLLLRFKYFELSFNLIPIWVILFSITPIFFWLWKSNYKSWGKGFIILYFDRISYDQIYLSLKLNY